MMLENKWFTIWRKINDTMYKGQFWIIQNLNVKRQKYKTNRNNSDNFVILRLGRTYINSKSTDYKGKNMIDVNPSKCNGCGQQRTPRTEGGDGNCNVKTQQGSSI